MLLYKGGRTRTGRCCCDTGGAGVDVDSYRSGEGATERNGTGLSFDGPVTEEPVDVARPGAA